jgi:gamma-butyrobetaine dioxygenase
MQSPTGPPGTPDYYHYDWHPIVSASLSDDTVTVTWADGVSMPCYSLWLAENTLGFGIEPVTREGMLDPADLPEAGSLVAVSVSADGAPELIWQDIGTLATRTTTIHPGWLRHIADGQHLPSYGIGPVERWDTNVLTEPPTLDGADILTSAATLRDWLRLMTRFGLARLQNTPASVDFLAELAGLIGPIRDTNFGSVWDVKAKLNADSTAYTGLNLGQHTDLPTRETPPGFQFLHCVENTCNGGWSRMTDGLRVVDVLAAEYPADFDALSTLRWVFFNRSSHADHRWSGPIIELGGPGQPLTLRAFYPVRGFPDMAAHDVPRAYAAMRRFSALAHDPRLQMRYPFTPGDIVGFDNRRILHGRDAFDPGMGTRHLRGTYIDQDDVFSRLRVLNRHFSR